ncbi:MAG: GntR family transcriptional regulator [Acetobacteraceae bacterium]
MTSRHATIRRVGENHLSLHDRVKAELMDAILSRRLKPGERIVEERLAADFGVSRNPVREAMRALASEGWIEVLARRGTFVASLSEQEARETIEVRALLEGHNARLAARRRDERILKRIETILAKGAAAVVGKRLDQLPLLNQQFHIELAAAGQNAVLGELLKRLRERTAALFAPGDPRLQALRWDEHAAILRAILEGDEDAAARRAAEHVTRAGEDFLAASESPEAPQPRSSPGRRIAPRSRLPEAASALDRVDSV